MAKNDYLSILKMMKLVKYQLFTESATKLDSESTCFLKDFIMPVLYENTGTHNTYQYIYFRLMNHWKRNRKSKTPDQSKFWRIINNKSLKLHISSSTNILSFSSAFKNRYWDRFGLKENDEERQDVHTYSSFQLIKLVLYAVLFLLFLASLVTQKLSLAIASSKLSTDVKLDKRSASNSSDPRHVIITL